MRALVLVGRGVQEDETVSQRLRTDYAVYQPSRAFEEEDLDETVLNSSRKASTSVSLAL